jgi:hypothetical protein
MAQRRRKMNSDFNWIIRVVWMLFPARSRAGNLFKADFGAKSVQQQLKSGPMAVKSGYSLHTGYRLKREL